MKAPLNVYGYSKLLFDQRMRRECGVNFERTKAGRTHQVVGFRYFNVYGPREQHKAAWPASHSTSSTSSMPRARSSCLANTAATPQGGQMRDFVFIDDVVAVNLWFFDNPAKAASSTWARAAPSRSTMWPALWSTPCGACAANPHCPWHDIAQQGLVEYVPFPDALRGKYQCYTQADLSALRATGCDHQFADVQTGVSRYVDWLASRKA